MTTEIEDLKEEIYNLRSDLSYIQSILKEEFELSNSAKSELLDARNTSIDEYVDLE